MMTHSEEHYRLYFGKKADHYLDIVRDFDSGKKIIFNVSSFFLGILWMLYRKLYKQIFVLFMLIFIEAWIEQIIFNTMNTSAGTMTLIDRLSMIVWGTLLGLFGNRIYVDQANRTIKKIIALNLSEEETNERIRKAGGTTLIPHLIIGLILTGLVILGRQGYFEP